MRHNHERWRCSALAPYGGCGQVVGTPPRRPQRRPPPCGGGDNHDRRLETTTEGGGEFDLRRRCHR